MAPPSSQRMRSPQLPRRLGPSPPRSPRVGAPVGSRRKGMEPFPRRLGPGVPGSPLVGAPAGSRSNWTGPCVPAAGPRAAVWRAGAPGACDWPGPDGLRAEEPSWGPAALTCPTKVRSGGRIGALHCSPARLQSIAPEKASRSVRSTGVGTAFPEGVRPVAIVRARVAGRGRPASRLRPVGPMRGLGSSRTGPLEGVSTEVASPRSQSMRPVQPSTRVAGLERVPERSGVGRRTRDGSVLGAVPGAGAVRGSADGEAAAGCTCGGSWGRGAGPARSGLPEGGVLGSVPGEAGRRGPVVGGCRIDGSLRSWTADCGVVGALPGSRAAGDGCDRCSRRVKAIAGDRRSAAAKRPGVGSPAECQSRRREKLLRRLGRSGAWAQARSCSSVGGGARFAGIRGASTALAGASWRLCGPISDVPGVPR